MFLLEVVLKSSRLVHLTAMLVLTVSFVGLMSAGSRSTVAAKQATAQATLIATSSASCTTSPVATLSATASGTLPATLIATTEPTSEATEADDMPIHFVTIQPTDIRFNPNADKPVALVTVYSLIFQNQLSAILHIEKPHFQLAINGVPWGELVSTDFQTGQMQGSAEQGIVLQNLTIIAKTSPEQKAILDCLKTYQPVDLTLTGTLDAYPNGTKQTVAVTLINRHVILREHKTAQ